MLVERCGVRFAVAAPWLRVNAGTTRKSDDARIRPVNAYIQFDPGPDGPSQVRIGSPRSASHT